jgi:hypothetical protein
MKQFFSRRTSVHLCYDFLHLTEPHVSKNKNVDGFHIGFNYSGNGTNVDLWCDGFYRPFTWIDYRLWYIQYLFKVDSGSDLRTDSYYDLLEEKVGPDIEETSLQRARRTKWNQSSVTIGASYFKRHRHLCTAVAPLVNICGWYFKYQLSGYCLGG